MVGDPAEQRARRHVVEVLQVGRRDAAFAGELDAEIADAGILDPRGKVQQHAVRAEIGQVPRLERIDRGKAAVFEQAGPVIVGAHLHPALVGADSRRGSFVSGLVFTGIVVALVAERVEVAPQGVHGKNAPGSVSTGRVVPWRGKLTVKSVPGASSRRRSGQLGRYRAFTDARHRRKHAQHDERHEQPQRAAEQRGREAGGIGDHAPDP